MLAMQYSFTLPADYDMAVIERRIRERGAALDGFPGLQFKTYLYARRDDTEIPSRENLYAPFYLWQDAQSMTRFLTSDGFAALTRDFGWPRIQSWLVVKAPEAAWVRRQTVARRVITPIPPYSSLAKVLDDDGNLLAWDCAAWQRLRLDFLPSAAAPDSDTAAQYYRIGYVALP